MEKPKEIYLASSLNGLYSYALTTLAEYEQKNAVALSELASGVLKEATDKYNEGDEELAYVFLIKYFKIFEYIQKAPDKKNVVLSAIATKTEFMEKADLLKKIEKCLIKRYKSKGIMTRDVGTQTDEVTFQCGNCNAITKLK